MRTMRIQFGKVTWLRMMAKRAGTVRLSQNALEQGSPFTTVYSDHPNLTYYQNPQKLSPWQAWWFLTLTEYNLKLKHLPGSKTIQLDTLSCWPDLRRDNREPELVTMLPETLFIKLINTDIQNCILTSTCHDREANKALKQVLEEGPTKLQNNLADWLVKTLPDSDKKMLFYQDRAYVPNDMELWWLIVKLHHNSPTIGHPRELGTYLAVKEHYWWPGMPKFVKSYVNRCPICQQYKINQRLAKPTLKPLSRPRSTRPFLQISINFIKQ